MTAAVGFGPVCIVSVIDEEQEDEDAVFSVDSSVFILYLSERFSNKLFLVNFEDEEEDEDDEDEDDDEDDEEHDKAVFSRSVEFIGLNADIFFLSIKKNI